MDEKEEIQMIEKRDSGVSSSLEELLYLPNEVKLFKSFAEKEHAVENLDFIEKIREFKTEKDISKAEEMKKNIYNTYLSEDPSIPLNITEKTLKKIQTAYKNQNTLLFNEAENEIMILLNGIYTNFTQTTQWEKYSLSNFKKPENAKFKEIYNIINTREILDKQFLVLQNIYTKKFFKGFSFIGSYEEIDQKIKKVR